MTRNRITAGVFCLAAVAFGQTVKEDMTADRPGFRNSTHLVGPGVLQLETGWRLSRDPLEGSGNAFTLEPEIRYGLTHWLELRLFTEEVVLRHARGTEDQPAPSGIADLQPGIKFPILDFASGTRVVAIVKTTVPTGHSSQTSHGYEPGAELIWEQELPRDFSLAGTWNLTRLKEDHFIWQKAASLALNHSFGDKLRTFGEVYVLSPTGPSEGNHWVTDAAIVRSVGRHLLLDASAGWTVHGPRSWFAMLGLSIRSKVPRTQSAGF